MEYSEYAIFDNTGQPIFASHYRTLADAMAVVTDALPGPYYAPLFPMTVEGLDRSDMYHVVARIARG